MKNGGWKTILSYWDFVPFQGRILKLQIRIPWKAAAVANPKLFNFAHENQPNLANKKAKPPAAKTGATLTEGVASGRGRSAGTGFSEMI